MVTQSVYCPASRDSIPIRAYVMTKDVTILTYINGESVYHGNLDIIFSENVKPTWKEIMSCPLEKSAYIKLPGTKFCWNDLQIQGSVFTSHSYEYILLRMAPLKAISIDVQLIYNPPLCKLLIWSSVTCWKLPFFKLVVVYWCFMNSRVSLDSYNWHVVKLFLVPRRFSYSNRQ